MPLAICPSCGHQATNVKCRKCGRQFRIEAAAAAKANQVNPPHPTLFPMPLPRVSDVLPGASPRGWLYVLSNYAMPDQLKVGHSCTDVFERVRDLNRQTANPGIFEIELHYVAESVEHHEANIHFILDEFRINKRREFFVCTLTWTYLKLKGYFGQEPDYIKPSLRESLRVVLRRRGRGTSSSCL